MFLVPERLETERLLLRLPQADDFTDYARMLAEPEVNRFVGGSDLQDPANAFRSLGWLIGHWHLRGYGLWVVVDKSSNALVGRVGPYYPVGWPALEIAWTIARPWWGQGLAAEAAKAARSCVIEHLQPRHLVSLVALDNERSAALALRLGCSGEQRITIRNIPCRVFVHPLHTAETSDPPSLRNASDAIR
jgi:RimJ/RimL family protein N-acetyltransferase